MFQNTALNELINLEESIDRIISIILPSRETKKHLDTFPFLDLNKKLKY